MRGLASGSGCRVGAQVTGWVTGAAAGSAGEPSAASAVSSGPADRGLEASEMGHLAERAQNSLLLGPEVDEDGDLLLDLGDLAESVHVVGDPVSNGEPLARWSHRGLEWAGGKTALRYPWLGHPLQYAPAEPGTLLVVDEGRTIPVAFADRDGVQTGKVPRPRRARCPVGSSRL